MADALTNTAAMQNLFLTAFDRKVGYHLRTDSNLVSLCDVQPATLNNPGDTIVMQVTQPLAVNTTPLDENTDVDAVAVPNTVKVEVTLDEYGNAIVMTNRSKLFNIATGGIDPIAVRLMADNQRDVQEALIRKAIDASQNVARYNGGAFVKGGSASAITASDTIKSGAFRSLRAKLVKDGVAPRNGSFYQAIIHPDVVADLRSEVGEASWRTPQEFQNLPGIQVGHIAGGYEGFVFTENARLTVSATGANGGNVYRTHLLGAEALVKAEAERIQTVLSPQVDKLRRFYGLGWKGTFGFGIYRQQALWNLETASAAAL